MAGDWAGRVATEGLERREEWLPEGGDRRNKLWRVFRNHEDGSKGHVEVETGQ